MPLGLENESMMLALGSPRLGTPFVLHLTHEVPSDDELTRLLASIAGESPAFSKSFDDSLIELLGASPAYVAAPARVVAENGMSEAPLTSLSPAPSSVAESQQPFVACNNKTNLDAKWSHLNELSQHDLKQYMRQHRLCEADRQAIMQSRRRFKSRQYSKEARERRLHRAQATGAEAEIEHLRAQLAQANAHIQHLTALLQQSGAHRLKEAEM